MTLIKNLSTILENQDLTESTKKMYMSNMKKIIELTRINEITEENKEEINKTIKNEKKSNGSDMSDNSKKNRYKALLVYLRNNEEKKSLWEYFNKEMKNVNNKIDKRLGENILKNKDKYEKWEVIKNVKLYKENMDKKLFLSFMVNDGLFLRLALFNIKLTFYDTSKDNFIKDDYLYMNDFKNVKKIGTQIFRLSKKTMKLVKEVKKENRLREYLFTIHNSQNKARFVRNIFKNSNINKEIGNNDLRKSYFNSFDFNKLTNNKIDKIAKRMLNSRNELLKNYRKIDG